MSSAERQNRCHCCAERRLRGKGCYKFLSQFGQPNLSFPGQLFKAEVAFKSLSQITVILRESDLSFLPALYMLRPFFG
jgi:hypothetical protein